MRNNKKHGKIEIPENVYLVDGRAVKECDLCEGGVYTPEEEKVEILGETFTRKFDSIECPHCQGRGYCLLSEDLPNMRKSWVMAVFSGLLCLTTFLGGLFALYDLLPGSYLVIAIVIPLWVVMILVELSWFLARVQSWLTDRRVYKSFLPWIEQIEAQLKEDERLNSVKRLTNQSEEDCPTYGSIEQDQMIDGAMLF